MKLTDKDIRKANRKGSRDAEIENGNGQWVQKTKVHKSQKDYNLFLG